LHMAQLMPLPLNVSCFSKIQIGFTFLVPAHLGSHRKRTVKQVCVCVCACYLLFIGLLIGSHASSAALALLVMSRRTGVSGECPFPGSHCPFPGILVLSTEVADGQPHVLHLRWSIASWLNTRSLLHVGHCGEKNCVDKISKNWLP